MNVGESVRMCGRSHGKICNDPLPSLSHMSCRLREEQDEASSVSDHRSWTFLVSIPTDSLERSRCTFLNNIPGTNPLSGLGSWAHTVPSHDLAATGIFEALRKDLVDGGHCSDLRICWCPFFLLGWMPIDLSSLGGPCNIIFRFSISTCVCGDVVALMAENWRGNPLYRPPGNRTSPAPIFAIPSVVIRERSLGDIPGTLASVRRRRLTTTDGQYNVEEVYSSTMEQLAAARAFNTMSPAPDNPYRTSSRCASVPRNSPQMTAPPNFEWYRLALCISLSVLGRV